jgi:NADH:ubiquinone oxidoreductase subunit 4 (subunit M)
MVAHGFLAALSFGLSGYIYNQTGTLEMSKLGGLARRLRFVGVALTMAALAGCGLPGFLNFVGEVTVFFGAWRVPALRVVTVLAVWGALIIGAVYMLRAVRAILHGPVRNDRTYHATSVVDANSWRKLPYALLIASLLVFGFFPKLLTDKITPVTRQIVQMAKGQAGSIAANDFLSRPHLGPLLQKRVNSSPSPSPSRGGTLRNDFRANETAQVHSPLPEGEGEQFIYQKENQSLLTSAATGSE